MDLLLPVLVSFVAFQTFSFEDLGDFGQWIGANIIKKLPFSSFQPAGLFVCVHLSVKRDNSTRHAAASD